MLRFMLCVPQRLVTSQHHYKPYRAVIRTCWCTAGLKSLTSKTNMRGSNITNTREPASCWFTPSLPPFIHAFLRACRHASLPVSLRLHATPALFLTPGWGVMADY
ncbi:hypothetical protein E2C01_081833 [Portunus trituberculatus]|uniref:Uncharacterized protein n=1 Tax=Portunus trituberculatus TaxID=210409 RepID=A0A5B7J261_PORTR|nr:hypothetical protein [Portunus trituberculatus]